MLRQVKSPSMLGEVVRCPLSGRASPVRAAMRALRLLVARKDSTLLVASTTLLPNRSHIMIVTARLARPRPLRATVRQSVAAERRRPGGRRRRLRDIHRSPLRLRSAPDKTSRSTTSTPGLLSARGHRIRMCCTGALNGIRVRSTDMFAAPRPFAQLHPSFAISCMPGAGCTTCRCARGHTFMPGWCGVGRLTRQRRSDAGIVINVTKRDFWMRFRRRGHTRRCGSRGNSVLATTDENHFHPDTIPCEITTACIFHSARKCLKEVADATVHVQGIT